MIAFDAAHKAVHYPEDRRFHIWISSRTLLIAVVLYGPLAWRGCNMPSLASLIYLPRPRPPKALRVGLMVFPSGFDGATSSICSSSSCSFAADFRSLWIILDSTGMTIAHRGQNGSASRRSKCQKTASGRRKTMPAMFLR